MSVAHRSEYFVIGIISINGVFDTGHPCLMYMEDGTFRRADRMDGKAFGNAADAEAEMLMLAKNWRETYSADLQVFRVRRLDIPTALVPTLRGSTDVLDRITLGESITAKELADYVRQK